MDERLVLIVTNRYDSHADYMIQKFWERGVPFARLNTDDYPNRDVISVTLDKKGDQQTIFCVHGKKFETHDVRSVWFRRPLRFQIDDRVIDAEGRQFAEDETAAFIDSLWLSLDCRWVSRPSSIRLAQQKILQLKRATELGFSVPKTIVTNEPAAFLRFYESCGGEVIYKTLGKNQTRDASGKCQFAYTNKIDLSFLEHSAEIAFAPCLFQEYVPKRVELRVTVVGGQMFACEIHSQKSERTRIDWRRYDIENTPHLPAKLPEGLVAKCVQLVRSFGLNFGAIDFIVTPNDEYIFVEINPNGQWLWIEQLTGLPISDALFEILTKEFLA